MKQLNKQQIFILASFLVFVIILINWIIMPAINYKQKTSQEISKNEVRLEELLQLEARLKAARSAGAQDAEKAQRGENFTLFAFLERLASREGLKNKIEFMRPSTRQVSEDVQERVVEMRLNNIYITELVPYLFHIENAPEKVYVKRMTIRKLEQDDAPLNVDLIFSSILSSA